MTRNRQLAKLLAPALLLSATLALPAPSAGVPFISGSKATVSKVKVEKEKPKKVKVKKFTTKKAGTKKVVTRKVTVKAARPAAQTIVVRPAAPRTVYVQPAYRTAAVPYRPSAGENSPLFAVAGVITDEGRQCLALRDRRGKLYTLVGKTEGLEIGDDVELMVRRVLPVYARECSQGDTVRVGQVRTIWSDASRRSAIYDSRYDGTFDPYQRDRYERDDNYDDRSGYDDRYDRYDRNDRYSGDDRYYDDDYGRDYRDENGRLISVTGRLGGTASCATLRDRDGRLFGLSGDLRNYDPGDTVRVIGFLQGGNRCGGPNIDVQEVRGQ